MLKDAKSFSSFSVNNLREAKDFYGHVLGLGVTEGSEGLELQLAGGNRAFLYPKPNHSAATFTVLNFAVSSVESAVDDLGKRGVQMEHYNSPDLKTDEKGIFRGPGPKTAWFKIPPAISWLSSKNSSCISPFHKGRALHSRR